MAQNLIIGLACLSIAVLLWALVVLAARWKRALHNDARWLLAALLAASAVHAISNLVEWTAADRVAMPIEDYFLLLLPSIWGSFFYAFLQAQSRAELRRSEERYRSLTDDVLDTTAAGICIIDCHGHVVWINQALVDYFGLNRTEIIGRDRARLIEDRWKYMVEDPHGWAERMLGVGKGGDVSEMECHILPSVLRQERWLEYRGQSIDAGLYVGGWIEHFYDITERKRAARLREQLLAVLESQKAELERFVYTVSHDLKSPLITIQGFLGVLQENLPPETRDDVRGDVKRIENAASRMERLLDELLDLARIGRNEGSSERVDLADAIAESLEIVHGCLVRRQVAVTVDDGMPSVWGHRARLVEVFQNLVDNAVKYLGDCPEPAIEISAKRRERDVLCFVRDNGIGIDSRYSGKVFELFEQLDPKQTGTGIGLAIVKRIVETHGGRIWVESEGKDRGSTFCFTLSIPPEGGESEADRTKAVPPD